MKTKIRVLVTVIFVSLVIIVMSFDVQAGKNSEKPSASIFTDYNNVYEEETLNCKINIPSNICDSRSVDSNYKRTFTYKSKNRNDVMNPSYNGDQIVFKFTTNYSPSWAKSYGWGTEDIFIDYNISNNTGRTTTTKYMTEERGGGEQTTTGIINEYPYDNFIPFNQSVKENMKGMDHSLDYSELTGTEYHYSLFRNTITFLKLKGDSDKTYTITLDVWAKKWRLMNNTTDVVNDEYNIKKIKYLDDFDCTSINIGVENNKRKYEEKYADKNCEIKLDLKPGTYDVTPSIRDHGRDFNFKYQYGINLVAIDNKMVFPPKSEKSLSSSKNLFQTITDSFTSNPEITVTNTEAKYDFVANNGEKPTKANFTFTYDINNKSNTDIYIGKVNDLDFEAVNLLIEDIPSTITINTVQTTSSNSKDTSDVYAILAGTTRKFIVTGNFDGNTDRRYTVNIAGINYSIDPELSTIETINDKTQLEKLKIRNIMFGLDKDKEQLFDTESPTTPADLNVIAISPTQMSVYWNPSMDNKGIVGYKVYRNASFLLNAKSNTYMDIGLIPGNKYCYMVSSYDAAGNTSTLTLSKCAVTPKENISSGGGGGSSTPIPRSDTERTPGNSPASSAPTDSSSIWDAIRNLFGF